MERRRFLAGLGLALAAGCLTLAGCGGGDASNLPEAKPATEIDIKQAMDDMEKQTKAMGKTPK